MMLLLYPILTQFPWRPVAPFLLAVSYRFVFVLCPNSGQQILPTGHIFSFLFGMDCEARMSFKWLKEKSKEYFVKCGNYMKFIFHFPK